MNDLQLLFREIGLFLPACKTYESDDFTLSIFKMPD